MAILELILKLLYKSEINYSTDDIGIKINKSKDIARTTISRNKQFFQEVDKKMVKNYLCFQNLGEQYCNKKVDTYINETKK